jgi:PAS domain S-box-containing protein
MIAGTPKSVSSLLDITERKQAQEALQQSEERFRALIESSSDVTSVIDSQGRVLYQSPNYRSVWGRDSQSEIGKDMFKDVHPDDASLVREAFAHLIQNPDDPVQLQLRALHTDGSWRTLEVVARNRLGYQTVRGIVVNFRDITARKLAEERILGALEEKDALLKEIHHRVKNNMQIISSLLRLQASTTRSQRAVNMFRESQDRIRSLALIHDKLYHSQSLARIDLAEYVKCLVDELFNAYRPSASGVSVSVDVSVDGTLVDMDTSIPCGLIINELVTNALKHGFPGGRAGEIMVRVFEDEGDTLTLLISDNGVGIPTTVDTKDPESLGLQLVNALTRQLGGTIEMDSTKGTSFRITFPRKRDA